MLCNISFTVSCGELKVLVAPRIFGVLGENVQMQCSVSGQADRHILTWYQQGELIYRREMNGKANSGPNFSDGRLSMASETDFSTLVITNSRKEDYGKKYRCNVRQKDDEQTGFTNLQEAGTCTCKIDYNL